MKKVSIAIALAISAAVLGRTALAFARVRVQSQQQAIPAPTPTTRILAIGMVNRGVDRNAVRAVLPSEVRETVDLYLDGRIDQWFSLQGRDGVAFILNVSDTVAARTMLERLPRGRAHLMTFELMPLAPLNPLRQLQGMQTPKR